MADFGEGKWRKAQKPHRCECCYGLIAQGESHYQYRGMYDGEWQDWRAHRECFAALEKDNCYEFMPGEFEVPAKVMEASR